MQSKEMRPLDRREWVLDEDHQLLLPTKIIAIVLMFRISSNVKPQKNICDTQWCRVMQAFLLWRQIRVANAPAPRLSPETQGRAPRADARNFSSGGAAADPRLVLEEHLESSRCILAL